MKEKDRRMLESLQRRKSFTPKELVRLGQFCGFSVNEVTASHIELTHSDGESARFTFQSKTTTVAKGEQAEVIKKFRAKLDL
jgi:hypothetical protein